MSEKEKKQEQTSELTPEERKKKRKKIILIVCLVVLAVIAAVVIYLLKKPKDVMTKENYKQIMEEMDEKVQDKKPIRCEVKRLDTDEVIFSTGVLPVGAELPPFKLDVDLEAGTYDAMCVVYLLDEEEDGTYTDYSNAGFNITITVQN